MQMKLKLSLCGYDQFKVIKSASMLLNTSNAMFVSVFAI